MTYLELKYMVLRYYELNPDKAKGYKSELEFLKQAKEFPEVIFPNAMSREITRISYVVNTLESGIKVVYPEGNDIMKTYFPTEYSEDDAVNAYALLLAEQSIESAHKYIKAPQNTTVFDIGASEGFFDKVYCDETNEIYGYDELIWKDAFLETTKGLNASFVDELVNKDTKIYSEFVKPLGCIKVDTEGMELDVLTAFNDLIDTYHPMIQAAVYHYHEEADRVVDWLKQKGYTHFDQAIAGKKMLFMNSIQYAPFFRYGVIIATM